MKKNVILLLLACITGCNVRNSAVKTGLEGEALPKFNMLLTDSTTYFNTSSIPDGQPVVLYCFSPRCPYCRAQMEEIIADISTMKDIRFYVFTNWPFPEMRDFFKHYELQKYPNMLVGEDYSNFFMSYFKALGVPYLAIYDKDKRLKKAFMGHTYSRQIKEVASD